MGNRASRINVPDKTYAWKVCKRLGGLEHLHLLPRLRHLEANARSTKRVRSKERSYLWGLV